MSTCWVSLTNRQIRWWCISRHGRGAGVFGLRRVGVVEGPQRGAVGGFVGVRACGAVGVAQMMSALPGGGLWGRLVHRD